jgi:hypothetical protein
MTGNIRWRVRGLVEKLADVGMFLFEAAALDGAARFGVLLSPEDFVANFGPRPRETRTMLHELDEFLADESPPDTEPAC